MIRRRPRRRAPCSGGVQVSPPALLRHVQIAFHSDVLHRRPIVTIVKYDSITPFMSKQQPEHVDWAMVKSPFIRQMYQ